MGASRSTRLIASQLPSVSANVDPTTRLVLVALTLIGVAVLATFVRQ
jgi:hypothetical protein